MLKTIGRHGQWLVVSLALVVACATSVEARVTRIVIDQKQSPAYEGKSFGSIGQYEILTGRAFGELDPKGDRDAEPGENDDEHAVTVKPNA